MPSSTRTTTVYALHLYVERPSRKPPEWYLLQQAAQKAAERMIGHPCVAEQISEDAFGLSSGWEGEAWDVDDASRLASHALAVVKGVFGWGVLADSDSVKHRLSCSIGVTVSAGTADTGPWWRPKEPGSLRPCGEVRMTEHLAEH